MNKLDKALELLKNDDVFIINETDRFIYFKVKGLSNEVYDVLFDKFNEDYNCTCRNVKLTTACYHIMACKIMRYANDNS